MSWHRGRMDWGAGIAVTNAASVSQIMRWPQDAISRMMCIVTSSPLYCFRQLRKWQVLESQKDSISKSSKCSLDKRGQCCVGRVTHTFNSATQEAEAGRSPSLRSFWATQ